MSRDIPDAGLAAMSSASRHIALSRATGAVVPPPG
jgi:hypothetical protein